jgi:hypothetical protein
MYIILPAALGAGVYSASNRNEYQKHKKIMILGSKVRRVRRADNLTTICEPIVYQCGIFNISQPCRPPSPVTATALLLLFHVEAPV